uniref:Uncharacterized protein n=1 Tax=Ascaris lumbricoides TaxID=6252 RepID=A0A0M3HNZ0_ASCLU
MAQWLIQLSGSLKTSRLETASSRPQRQSLYEKDKRAITEEERAAAQRNTTKTMNAERSIVQCSSPGEGCSVGWLAG